MSSVSYASMNDLICVCAIVRSDPSTIQGKLLVGYQGWSVGAGYSRPARDSNLDPGSHVVAMESRLVQVSAGTSL